MDLMMGVFIVLVLAFFAGLVVAGIYEVVALLTGWVPTITSIVKVIILHFTPDRPLHDRQVDDAA